MYTYLRYGFPPMAIGKEQYAQHTSSYLKQEIKTGTKPTSPPRLELPQFPCESVPFRRADSIAHRGVRSIDDGWSPKVSEFFVFFYIFLISPFSVFVGLAGLAGCPVL